MSDEEWLSRNSFPSRKRDRRSYADNWDIYEARGSGNYERLLRRRFDSSVDLSRADASLVDSHSTRSPNGGDSNHNVTMISQCQSASNVSSKTTRIFGAAATKPPTSTSSSKIKVHSSGEHSERFNALFLKSLSNPPATTVTLPMELRSTLNTEQCTVVESILSGHSTFFTGPAGSGKSHILNTLLKANKCGIGGRNNEPRNIVITATTGVSACNIGGTTIHSFSGVGAGNASSAEIIKRVMGNEYTKQRWREVDILVIDEISMMASSFLDKLDFVAQRARNNRRPFGGVQLVVCGDFFQLPPVELRNDGFAFEAKCWPQVIKRSVLLHQVFRQQGDMKLMNILQEARVGELTIESSQVLKRHGTHPAFRKIDCNFESKIIPTLLECRNREVDKANDNELGKLPGDVYSFNSRDRAISEAHKAQLKHCQAPAKLELKVGAQVILLKNIDLDRGLANGSRGVVVRFQPPKNEVDVPVGFKKMDLPVVRFESIMIGKDKSNCEGHGADGDREFIIHPEEWTNKIGDQTVSARVQIPLRLAWSISVHKSQGMTIPNLTVNLSGVFEYGQAYVALSRATELNLLTLQGYSENAFRAHPLVKKFYKMLESTKDNKMNNKENFGVQPDNTSVDFADACKNVMQHSRPLSSPVNTQQRYQRKISSSNISSNPYQRSLQAHKGSQSAVSRSLSQCSVFVRSPGLDDAISTLTQDQIQRMEENRQRALAIRLQRQHDSSS